MMGQRNEEGLWDWPLQESDDGIVKVHNDLNSFEVDLEAQNFQPNEIKVQVIGRILDIHFEHKNNPGASGTTRDIDRDLSRSYKLPDDVDAGSVRHRLDHGKLIITAAKKPSK